MGEKVWVEKWAEEQGNKRCKYLDIILCRYLNIASGVRNARRLVMKMCLPRTDDIQLNENERVVNS